MIQSTLRPFRQLRYFSNAIAPTTQELAGFFPRPAPADAAPPKGFGGGKALFVFFLCNAVPVSAAVWYFRKQKDELAQNTVHALPSTSADVIRESLRVIRTAPHPMLVFGEHTNVFCVDPHVPQSVLHLTEVTESKDVLDSVLPDLFTTDAEDAVPLRAIHFCTSRAAFDKIREASSHSLVYTSPSRQGYVTLRGRVAQIEDASLKARFWKRRWAALVAPYNGEDAFHNPDYVLVRLVPHELRFQSMAVQWASATAQRNADGWEMV